MEHVEEIDHAGCVIHIYQDYDGADPRKDFDNAATLVSFDPQTFGGDRGYQDYYREECATEWAEEGAVVVWCRYEDYGSSGAHFRTGYEPDNANAALVVNAATLEKEWSGNVDKARAYMEGEAATFDAYVSGEVYGYVVEDREGIPGDSLWGFFAPYGSSEWDYMIGEAKSAAEDLAERVAAELAERAEMAARDIVTV